MKWLRNITTEGHREKENCVVCGCETSYTMDVPIDKRSFYVEGSGQLCEKCYYAIYHSNNRHRETLY